VTAASRRLLWPSLMTAAMLIVLLSLGTWQVRRLFWKEALLAQIDRAEAADPIPLSTLTSSEAPSPFMKVSITGTFLAGEAALYGADVRDVASGPAMGARLIEPMREAGGEVILVDRGWVPLSRPVPIDQPAGTVTVSGYIRFGDSPHWFSGKDDLAARHFYTLDPKVIADALSQPDVRPFVLVALAAAPESRIPADHWPDPARHLPRPPNSHLSYAITWYGLAVALLAIFIVWAKRDSLA
jgi:surfeit locus 1 family protein